LLSLAACHVTWHVQAKTKKMSEEKRVKVDAQIAKLETALSYVEQQRVSAAARI
jgi:hypothetical protein